MHEPEQSHYLRCIKHRYTYIVATHCAEFEQAVAFNINRNCGRLTGR